MAAPGKVAMVCDIAPAAFFSRDVDQIGGNNVDIAGGLPARHNRCVLILRVVSDGHVGGHGPGSRGPDQTIHIASGQRGVELGQV